MIAQRDRQAAADPFERIRDLMYQVSGVSMNESKRELVRSRVSRRIRILGLESIEAYAELVSKDGGKAELAIMVDLLTTNKTSFFRESSHFDFLNDHVFPGFAEGRRSLRIWSAGCSSGEEPYTLAMVILERWPDADRRDIRILATDLSPTVLEEAKRGVYTEDALAGVSAPLRGKYLRRTRSASGEERAFEFTPSVRKLVSFAQLNLMTNWPMKGPFDVILCRNVMIYFDRPTRTELIRRFSGLLSDGGHLLVGHSESLNGLGHDLAYVQPAVYRR
jgi:chemotaxis protein methyltransferase CheR